MVLWTRRERRGERNESMGELKDKGGGEGRLREWKGGEGKRREGKEGKWKGEREGERGKKRRMGGGR